MMITPAFGLRKETTNHEPVGIKQIIEEWKETANVYADSERLADIVEAEAELAQGGGEDWEQLRQELKI